MNLRTEILLGNDFRLHSAVYGPYGRVVAVKVFEGPHARQVRNHGSNVPAL